MGRLINTYDSLNRLTSRNIQTGNGVLGITSETYNYDSLGRLISATDNKGNDLSFEYDSLGRLINETNGAKQINYTYDIGGNKTSVEIDSRATNYNYDSNSRLESITQENQNIINYTYDSLNKTSQTLGNGQVTNYSFDELNRLKSMVNEINSYSYTYNTNGNIISNGTDNYIYDNLDRITGVNYQNQHIKQIGESFEYDSMGNRIFETTTRLNKKGKEVNKEFQYTTNNLNQYLDRVKYSGEEDIEEETNTGTIESTSTGTIEVISSEIMTEEDIEEETEDVIEEEEEIELEGRLIYDNNGNLIGNLLNNKRQYIYSYDYKNRLVKIEKNIYKKVNGSETNEIEQITKIVEIKYDILDRRISKIFNNGSYIKYYYSNNDIILEENYTKKDKLKDSKEFVYGLQTDDIISMKTIENKTRKIEEEYVNNKGVTKTRKVKEEYLETKMYYYSKDHLGSIVAITDENANIVEEYVYDVFGKPYSKQEDGKITNLKKSPIGNTRLYTGREYDRGLKIYYNRARYYNPELGRFISRDPIDISDDVNLYAYVGNNGVMFVDRFGKEKALLMIVDRFNFYGAYFENLYSFKTHEIFSDITLSPEKGNIKLNTEIRELGLFIDNNHTTETSGKKIVIDGKDIWLADIGNILYGYNASKAGYGENYLKTASLLVTSLAWDQGYKQEGVWENEKEDWKYYEAGYNLVNNTTTGEITKDDILKSYFNIHQNGR